MPPKPAEITMKTNTNSMRAVLSPKSVASKFPKESKSLKILFQVRSIISLG